MIGLTAVAGMPIFHAQGHLIVDGPLGSDATRPTHLHVVASLGEIRIGLITNKPIINLPSWTCCWHRYIAVEIVEEICASRFRGNDFHVGPGKTRGSIKEHRPDRVTEARP